MGESKSSKEVKVIFDTTAGEIVVEFRNDSNGYYGGELRMLPRERN